MCACVWFVCFSLVSYLGIFETGEKKVHELTGEGKNWRPKKEKEQDLEQWFLIVV